VSDFADFMGQGVTAEHTECRLLIPHHDFGVNAALLVRSALGLRNVSRYQLRDEPGAQPWVARQYSDEAGAVWCDLDFGQLLGNADFLMVEA
jgi:twitching motility protein PilI